MQFQRPLRQHEELSGKGEDCCADADADADAALVVAATGRFIPSQMLILLWLKQLLLLTWHCVQC